MPHPRIAHHFDGRHSYLVTLFYHLALLPDLLVRLIFYDHLTQAGPPRVATPRLLFMHFVDQVSIVTQACPPGLASFMAQGESHV